MRTAPELQQDVTLLLKTLVAITEMVDRTAPTEEDCHKHLDEGTMEPMTGIMFMIMRRQIEECRSVIEGIRLNSTDANLKQELAKFDKLVARAKS